MSLKRYISNVAIAFKIEKHKNLCKGLSELSYLSILFCARGIEKKQFSTKCNNSLHFKWFGFWSSLEEALNRQKRPSGRPKRTAVDLIWWSLSHVSQHLTHFCPIKEEMLLLRKWDGRNLDGSLKGKYKSISS